MARRGYFLSLDGLDGTGKSTQLKLLAQWLTKEGYTVTTCVDPGGTELGQRLREILLYGRETTMNARTEALLFMASRSELVQQVIRPALERGEVVLSDRYLLANVVYQGHAGGIPPDEIWKQSLFPTQGLYPDHVLVLDAPVPLLASRRAHRPDRIETRGEEYFERVRNGFRAEVLRDPAQHTLVDATGTVAEVHMAIVQAISARLPHVLG